MREESSDTLSASSTTAKVTVMLWHFRNFVEIQRPIDKALTKRKKNRVPTR